LLFGKLLFGLTWKHVAGYAGDGLPSTLGRSICRTVQETENTQSAGFKILLKAVRQGCILSTQLFNIVAEMAMRKALEGYERGIRISGREITNLLYVKLMILFFWHHYSKPYMVL